MMGKAENNVNSSHYERYLENIAKILSLEAVIEI